MTGKLARQQRRLNARLPLILMTDARPADWGRAARRLPRGAMVIVRGQTRAARTALLAALEEVAIARFLRLLVAGDPALAAGLGAAGLHLPEARLDEAGHWRARHPGWIITAAVHSAAALARAQERDLDALLLSPVFATASHPSAPVLGPVRGAMIATASRVPVYALGGIGPHNAARLPRAFSGIAAITSLL